MPDSPVTLHHGNCMTVLPTIPTASVDSIVTDPPYELGFMGKSWDASGIAYNVELWRECLRVLKPGGHLLAFGGTRTYHRMVVAIEDAGFEIRDSIHWLYGSGFPKSLDVSKAIDKQRYGCDDVLKVTAWVRAARDAAGITNRDIDAAFGTNGMAGHWTTLKSQSAVPTLDQVPTLLDVLGVKADEVPDDIRRLLWDLNGKKGEPGKNWAKREVVGTASVPVGHAFAGPVYGGDSSNRDVPVTAASTDAAKQWEGWGTALKPAHEPIVVARKPLAGTVAANVLEHGTGALNIDGCRVAGALEGDPHRFAKTDGGSFNSFSTLPVVRTEGRWPANIVFTHAADCDTECVPGCPVAELDSQSGTLTSGSRNAGDYARLGYQGWDAGPMPAVAGDARGASRFFTVTEWDELDVPFRYVAKPRKKERNAGLDGLPEKVIIGFGEQGQGPKSQHSPRIPVAQTNHHPTVKPVALMRWLVRLVTPPEGNVLDPFAGSGTTLVAARLEGFAAIGIEMTDDYLPIIEGRVAWAAQQAAQLTLFGDKGRAA